VITFLRVALLALADTVPVVAMSGVPPLAILPGGPGFSDSSCQSAGTCLSREWQPTEVALFLPFRRARNSSIPWVGRRFAAVVPLRPFEPTISEKNYVVCKKNHYVEILYVTPNATGRSADRQNTALNTRRADLPRGQENTSVTRGRPR
jgi:hypothetical protein